MRIALLVILFIVVSLFSVNIASAEWLQVEDFETGSESSVGYPTGWDYTYDVSGVGANMRKSDSWFTTGSYSHVFYNGYSTQAWTADDYMSISKTFDFTNVDNASLDVNEFFDFDCTTDGWFNITLDDDELYFSNTDGTDVEKLIYLDVGDYTGDNELNISIHFETSGSCGSNRYLIVYVDNLSFDYAALNPGITVASYNHSTAYNDASEIVWRTNQSAQSHTEDPTPTIRFNTDINADCRIGLTDDNFTTLNSSRDCTTTGAKSQVCTLIDMDSIDYDDGEVDVYLGCRSNSTPSDMSENSTSGALNVHYMLYNFTGTTKDGDGNGLENISVYIRNQDTNALVDNTTSDSSGDWTKIISVIDNTVKHIVYAWDPINYSRPADSKAFVVVS